MASYFQVIQVIQIISPLASRRGGSSSRRVMERGVVAGPTDGRRSSGGYKRVIGPRSLDCPEDAPRALGDRCWAWHPPRVAPLPVCAWRSMLGIRRCARRSEEAVPRGVRNALLMRAGSLAGTRGGEPHGVTARGPIRLRPSLGWMIHVRGRASGGLRRVCRPVPIPCCRRTPVPSGHGALTP